MRYTIPNCPKCGERLVGECEFIPGLAEVEQQPDGSFEYTGETTLYWDLSRNQGGELGLAVQCHYGHVWFSERTAD